MDYIFNYYMIAAVTVSTRFGDVFFTILVFGLSLPLVVCRRADVLFMLFVFVWFVCTSSCL